MVELLLAESFFFEDYYHSVANAVIQQFPSNLYNFLGGAAFRYAR